MSQGRSSSSIQEILCSVIANPDNPSWIRPWSAIKKIFSTPRNQNELHNIIQPFICKPDGVSLIKKLDLPESLNEDRDRQILILQLQAYLLLASKYYFVSYHRNNSDEVDEVLCDELCPVIQRMRLRCITDMSRFQSFLEEMVVKFVRRCPRFLAHCFEKLDLTLPPRLAPFGKPKNEDSDQELSQPFLSPTKLTGLHDDDNACQEPPSGYGTVPNPADDASDSNSCSTLSSLRRSTQGSVCSLKSSQWVSRVQSTFLWTQKKQATQSRKRKNSASPLQRNSVTGAEKRPRRSPRLSGTPSSRKAAQQCTPRQRVRKSSSSKAASTMPRTPANNRPRGSHSRRVRQCQETPVKDSQGSLSRSVTLPQWERVRQLASNKARGKVVVQESPHKVSNFSMDDGQSTEPVTAFVPDESSNCSMLTSPTLRRSLRRVQTFAASTQGSIFLPLPTLKMHASPPKTSYGFDTVDGFLGASNSSQRQSNLFCNFLSPLKSSLPPLPVKGDTPKKATGDASLSGVFLVESSLSPGPMKMAPDTATLGSAFHRMQDPVYSLCHTPPLPSILKSPLKRTPTGYHRSGSGLAPPILNFQIGLKSHHNIGGMEPLLSDGDTVDSMPDLERGLMPHGAVGGNVTTPVKSVLLSPTVRKRTFHNDSSPMLFSEDAMFLDTREFRVHSGSAQRGLKSHHSNLSAIVSHSPRKVASPIGLWK